MSPGSPPPPPPPPVAGLSDGITRPRRQHNMAPRWARRRRSGSALLLLLGHCWLWAAGADDNGSQLSYYTALINVTVMSPERGGPTLLRIDRGRYGQDSPKVEVKGLLVTPVPINGGTGDIVAVMITESKVKEILNYLEKNISVLMAIAVGSRVPLKNFSRGSLVFVSISFIVLMIISSAWLIFYFIQKIRYTSARDRNQRRLGDAAKKAVGKLTTRTVKKGDKETDPDFDHCAVCIESYKQNDVVRILPCKHVFHKACVDPWLSEHCTCPMCKLNILKALGIVPNVPCTDNVAFDMERLSRSQPASRRSALGDFTNDSSLSLEPLRTSGMSQLPQDGELTPRSGEINIAVTKEWFIIASFGLLSALTLCYMIIKATASLNANEAEWY
ncbi:E3 ubiquitin-protein ligase RNF130 isoform X4 [Coturnix japonica]|uniref:E3 ubiquitin-protein ligase RNF130 isoform X4 n=1 Tax=Coturnix japonica TaxID=93934 RepID=UPI0013A5D836|nr:E3 ubiquitin-protein ligase RNF130 isoform X4 [Coturnix japonica]